MPELAAHVDCTGCGACAFRCPRNCIRMQEDVIGVVYPQIDRSLCIECGACEKACPILDPVEFHDSELCYAAWNNDQQERRLSASGGIATAIYKEALSRGFAVIGAMQNSDWTVAHKFIRSFADIGPFKNSKYVFSHAYDIFHKVKLLLKDSKHVLMIGLPCQIAAMRKLFAYDDNLVLIDLVCHGSCPTKYLRQHILSLESVLEQKAVTMSFRAPEKGTENYYFTLYNADGEIFYSKRSVDGDMYNFAFHRAISYRENCYNCRYARPDRVSDITLGDFHGLGKLQPCAYSEKKVSTILVHTSKGREFIDSIVRSGNIHVEKRPVEESVMGDAQLRRPSPKTKARLDFERFIVSTNGDFVLSISKVKKRMAQREFKDQCKNIIKGALNRIYRISDKLKLLTTHENRDNHNS